jgi:hypothetical protein
LGGIYRGLGLLGKFENRRMTMLPDAEASEDGPDERCSTTALRKGREVRQPSTSGAEYKLLDFAAADKLIRAAPERGTKKGRR